MGDGYNSAEERLGALTRAGIVEDRDKDIFD